MDSIYKCFAYCYVFNVISIKITFKHLLVQQLLFFNYVLEVKNYFYTSINYFIESVLYTFLYLFLHV